MSSTKDLLINKAGKLFAENGLNGTSIKKIADETEQNIAAVNYHFGSKENLFLEILKMVLKKAEFSINADISTLNKSQAIDLVKKFIEAKCNFFLSKNNPNWYGQLIVKAVHETPESIQDKVAKFFYPDFEKLQQLAMVIRPDYTFSQAQLWAHSIMGQMVFYIFGQKMIFVTNEISDYSTEYINKVIKHISDSSISFIESKY